MASEIQKGSFLLSGLLLLLLLGGSAISLRNYHQNRFAYESADDLRGAVRLIYERMGPKDAVLVNAGYLYPAFAAYWPDEVGWLGRLSEYSSGKWSDEGPLVVMTGHVDGDADIGWGDPNSDFYAISSAETAERMDQLLTRPMLCGFCEATTPSMTPADLFAPGLTTMRRIRSTRFFRARPLCGSRPGALAERSRADMPTSAQPMQTRFSDGIELLGYEISPLHPNAGKPLRLTQYWQRVGPIGKAYKVFVQVLDDTGKVVTQDDAEPGRGAFPTDQWQSGEVVSSSYVLPLSSQHPLAGIGSSQDSMMGRRANV